MISDVGKLRKCSDELVDAQIEYSSLKLSLKKEEAELFLYENWEETLGKSKPTQKDKENHITLKTLKSRNRVDEASARLEKAKREYEICKIELKYIGDFLNTVAGVCNDE